MTAEARLSLNGPEVIESEAGIYEIDSTDRSAIWAATGGRARVAAGLADRLVLDDVGAMRAAVAEALKVHPTNSHRSQRLTTTRQWIETNTPTHQALKTDRKVPTSTPERGTIWTEALTEVDLMRPCPSVLRGELRLDVREAVILSIAVDPESRYHRAAHGELGLREGLVLAEQIIQVVKTDQSLRPTEKRPIIAIVDVPSQAYGWIEETTGLHHVLACAVDAYATARMAGHPIIALVVGQAISGGFLAHGFQANQILALDDPGVQIHAMHQAAAARITRRSLESLEILERTVLPMSRRVSDWAKLGLCDQLISINDPDAPTASDLTMVRSALTLAVDRARMEPLDLSNRRIFTGNSTTRRATQEVMARMAAQW
jgi:malonate decarboxylase beta subunit